MKVGVMALTVLKNLVKGPATIRYPYQPAKVTPVTRGHLLSILMIVSSVVCAGCIVLLMPLKSANLTGPGG